MAVPSQLTILARCKIETGTFPLLLADDSECIVDERGHLPQLGTIYISPTVKQQLLSQNNLQEGGYDIYFKGNTKTCILSKVNNTLSIPRTQRGYKASCSDIITQIISTTENNNHDAPQHTGTSCATPPMVCTATPAPTADTTTPASPNLTTSTTTQTYDEFHSINSHRSRNTTLKMTAKKGIILTHTPPVGVTTEEWMINMQDFQQGMNHIEFQPSIDLFAYKCTRCHRRA
ncbi:hypothetical protein SARC_00770 [Sphaeroforma arctica JP610]|uniref:Uncharacterized protein n=1 Tax=Sphaeroforma arctica JP610 TaxID=667725 RepID=A0A0L0GDX9_9EUKA|nr:hypothetical protein SARC_00770 [Sphaeroforma arctica JP610]KNC87094.1 hypothetical protein SARC_00770 [Sphaeroforma arctica JP610]|eukprot:XP_014160996.1 hypothetical protein SARC_00770 [Sphaeroforma arctica JP610]